jgi:hypothetical protein
MMKWLLLAFLLSDYQALTPAQKSAFRDATRQIITSSGDKDTFTQYTNSAGAVYYIMSIGEDQIDARPAQVAAYRNAVTNRMPNSLVEISLSPSDRLTALGLSYKP